MIQVEGDTTKPPAGYTPTKRRLTLNPGSPIRVYRTPDSDELADGQFSSQREVVSIARLGV